MNFSPFLIHTLQHNKRAQGNYSRHKQNTEQLVFGGNTITIFITILFYVSTGPSKNMAPHRYMRERKWKKQKKLTDNQRQKEKKIVTHVLVFLVVFFCFLRLQFFCHTSSVRKFIKEKNKLKHVVSKSLFQVDFLPFFMFVAFVIFTNTNKESTQKKIVYFLSLQNLFILLDRYMMLYLGYVTRPIFIIIWKNLRYSRKK